MRRQTSVSVPAENVIWSAVSQADEDNSGWEINKGPARLGTRDRFDFNGCLRLRLQPAAFSVNDAPRLGAGVESLALA